jgi:hypothetical protein
MLHFGLTCLSFFAHALETRFVFIIDSAKGVGHENLELESLYRISGWKRSITLRNPNCAGGTLATLLRNTTGPTGLGNIIFILMQSNHIANFMLPKRKTKIWMAERTFGNAFSKYFSKGEYSIWDTFL